MPLRSMADASFWLRLGELAGGPYVSDERQSAAAAGSGARGDPTTHYSVWTEQAYLQWIRRFILFHGKRHPREMGAPELTAFLTDLAVQHHVSASTQNQALHAILFLYRDVLKVDL